VPPYQAIAWLPLCGGLTVLGLVLSWAAWRRRGTAAGLRGVAWSLLPVAAWLTGVIKIIWTFASAVVDFAWSTVFSFKGWAGIIVAGVAAVLFVTSGALRRWRPRQPKGTAAAAPGQRAAAPAAAPATSLATAKRAPTAPDEDFSEVAQILRRHGIK
jgi:cytochrome c oxidase assembly factor CtaG